MIRAFLILKHPFVGTSSHVLIKGKIDAFIPLVLLQLPWSSLKS